MLRDILISWKGQIKYVDSGIMDELTDDDKLQDVKIMGAIVHPRFQSKIRMVDAGLCNET